MSRSYLRDSRRRFAVGVHSALTALLILAAPVAVGQAALPATIETTQSATLENPPDYVEFLLELRATGATFEEAMAKAVPFESKLREALSERELAFIQLETAGPAIPDVCEPVVTVSARLRFSAVGLGDAEEGAKALAALCDKIAALSRALDCQPKGPFPGVLDKTSVEAAVVEQAMENAYPHAEAAAKAIRAQIVAVDSVQIQDVGWDTVKGDWFSGVFAGTVACTARVKVTYVFSVSGS
jgi:Protein of unknown function (DUF541)